MKLSKLEIEGYKSIRNKIEIFIEPNITSVLGANDHGKSNLLSSLLHLNDDKVFDVENDLNWDCEQDKEKLPSIKYTLKLNDEEKIEANRIYIAVKKQSEIKKLVSEKEKIVEEIQEEIDEYELRISELHIDDEGEMDSLHDRVSTAKRNLDGELKKLYLYELESLKIKDSEIEDINNLEVGFENLSEEMEELKDKIKEFQALRDEANNLAAVRNSQGNPSAAEKEREKANQAQTELDKITNREELVKEQFEIINKLREIISSDFEFFHLKADTERELSFKELDREVEFQRIGVDNDLELLCDDSYSEELVDFLFSLRPKVELVKSNYSIMDSISEHELEDEKNEFMQGIFLYAGLTRDKWTEVFSQSPKTTKLLDDASAQLNRVLKKDWSQGAVLNYKLDHHNGDIALYIQDPAINSTYTQASKRSSGFANFFTLKTVLYARQEQAKANSYIWLFDEPGIYLHPAGQYDLLRSLETLGKNNQIIFSTHSIFLINKNHPLRHRLLIKNDDGTDLDGKPYKGQWKAAFEILGLSLPGTVLFPSKVLLVEGDSDPIYLYAIIQKIIEMEELNIDINDLAIVSTNNSKNAHVLLDIFVNSSYPPTVSALYDNDKSGKDRRKLLENLNIARDISFIELDDECEVEDYLILQDEIYIEAVAEYIADYLNDNETDYITILKESLEDEFDNNTCKGVSKLVKEACQKIEGLEGGISKLGIARKYSQLLINFDQEIEKIDYDRALKLVNNIIDSLNLHKQTIDNKNVLLD